MTLRLTLFLRCVSTSTGHLFDGSMVPTAIVIWCVPAHPRKPSEVIDRRPGPRYVTGC